MVGSFGRRLVQSFVLVCVITIAVFLILRLTAGDPAAIKGDLFANEDVIQRYRQEFGTDQPLAVQLQRFLWGVVHGDLGESFRYQRPVMGLVLQRLPLTAGLALFGLTLSVVLAVVLGSLAAHTPGGWLDRFTLALSVLSQSAPNFWIGLMLILLFSLQLHWFPATGYHGFRGLVLPGVTVALSILPVQLRVVRTAMGEALSQEYTAAARAMGLPEWRILFVYALRNAILPLITVLGIHLGHLLGGAIVTEAVFGYPGLGDLALTALNARDYPLVQGITVFTASVFLLANPLVDLVYTWVDPRIRGSN